MSKIRSKGEGSYYQRQDNKHWQYEFYIEGRRKRLSAKTKSELNKKIEEYKKKYYSGKIVKNSKITLGDIILSIQENKLNLNQIAESTYKRNLETLELIKRLELADIQIQKITINDLNEFSNKIKIYSNSTIGKAFRQIKLAFKEGIIAEIITKDIVKDYKVPISDKKDKEVKALTIEEQQEFMQLIPESRYYIQFLIALNTGARMGEINALHINDIDFINNKININKTVTKDKDGKLVIKENTKTIAGQRTIDINKFLLNPLKEFCKNKKGYLFSDKKIISTASISYEMKKLLNNFSVSPHILRHTFTTRSIEADINPAVLKEILGHKDISTTLNIYTEVQQELKDLNTNKFESYIDKLYNYPHVTHIKNIKPIK